MWIQFGVGQSYPLDLNIVNKFEDLHNRFDKVQPDNGYWDFKSHCDGHMFSNTEWFEDEYSPAEVAEFIKNHSDWNGEPIRLLACKAGKFAHGAAYEIAYTLRVEVKAPIDTLWVYDNGDLLVSSNDPNEMDADEILLSNQVQEHMWQIF